MPHSKYECLLAVNAIHKIEGNKIVSLLDTNRFLKEKKDWLFGHLTYDFKNIIEPKLKSRHSRNYGWNELSFFCPETVCYVKNGEKFLTVESLNHSPEEIFQNIFHIEFEPEVCIPNIDFQSRINKETYLEIIEKLRKHIADGDCYEINYCCEGFAENTTIKPLQVFQKLNQISPAPFAAFYKNNDNFLICASPERYLLKTGITIRSMPIKGTIKRGSNPLEDEERKLALLQSEKDLAENVMIVDLVRNDLARSCEVGSIEVEELFGVYTFPQVHHLISSLQGTLSSKNTFTEAIKNSFPMGSMTGAPKIKVMELTDEYEQSRRELFSGSVGYFSPDGDFDFNVVIRSLFYNSRSKYLSYHTGGAITYDSNPEQEYEEMRLKAWALEQVFK